MPATPQERLEGAVSVKPADFQMRFREILSRAAADHTTVLPKRDHLGPYLAISRQAGSGGAEVARRLGERLDWKVLDRELVDDLARRLELSPKLLELMDETRSNWFSETLLNLMNSRLVLQGSYVAMLGKVMALAAWDGPVIIVGRGGHLMLPRTAGLSVRITASRDFCIRQIAAREALDEAAAGRRADEMEASRTAFMHRHFHCDANDASLYDLVVDASSFSIDGTIDVVHRALEVRRLL